MLRFPSGTRKIVLMNVLVFCKVADTDLIDKIWILQQEVNSCHALVGQHGPTYKWHMQKQFPQRVLLRVRSRSVWVSQESVGPT